MTHQLDILAFGAHPDDVELGCGGALSKLADMGYATGIIDLTEGEMGTRGTVAERYTESAKAARILGASIRENLKILDAQIYLTEENKFKVMEVIRRFRPALVFAPYPKDRHPDHTHSSRLITDACFYAGLMKMEIAELPPHRPQRVLYYMITTELTPSFVVDISEHFSKKMEAIKAHRSQFYNPDYPGEETFISSKSYFESIEFRARHLGWQTGVEYAEPFWVRDTIVLDDVFKILVG